MRIIIATANYSPAVANRRAKYDDKFRVKTLLGAQPPDHTARASPTLNFATQNIGTAVKPEEGGKLAHERL
jgi:hypothetical protein